MVGCGVFVILFFDVMFVFYCYVLMLSWMNSEKKKCGKINTKKKKKGEKENKIKKMRL